jgi:transposase
MKLYAGIDLHSNNSVVSVIDEHDRVVAEKRLPNELERIVLFLAAFKQALVGIVVESTFNWYWLVDGLMEAGYRVHLANPAAMQQYEGIKHTDDEHDARWLAHLLRLEILPEGYIYPRQARGVRDLMRRRMQLVECRSQQLLAMQTQLMRSRGHSMRVSDLKALELEQIAALVQGEPNLASALRANLVVAQVLTTQIERLEREILGQVKLAAQFRPLRTIPGVGEILGLCIMLETGEIGRFPGVGNFASYARCVDSQRLSNGKKKGAGNAKCGNRYLAWAFVEAAHFAVRYNTRIKRFYQRKAAKTNSMVAIKAVAHKLARAAYHIMRTHQPFEEARAFA